MSPQGHWWWTPLAVLHQQYQVHKDTRYHSQCTGSPQAISRPYTRHCGHDIRLLGTCHDVAVACQLGTCIECKKTCINTATHSTKHATVIQHKHRTRVACGRKIQQNTDCLEPLSAWEQPKHPVEEGRTRHCNQKHGRGNTCPTIHTMIRHWPCFAGPTRMA